MKLRCFGKPLSRNRRTHSPVGYTISALSISLFRETPFPKPPDPQPRRLYHFRLIYAQNAVIPQTIVAPTPP